ncbi:hypothetical protein HUK80_16520 [Flavobacterium sp. MAH-1]|uniref:Tetratricopeptide repeat-containing protein n=1 Tax=Flavobacterium agri TaxID=2743471 RepID=A0A7Y8Y535_9FLAO|nr:hypothetical protein [Flavobacterium agri]NUY82511.1 hypothetical protein [Flavobacterium agri]NYA72535.1 hypothetical protein [Flavobacterium agri]
MKNTYLLLIVLFSCFTTVAQDKPEAECRHSLAIVDSIFSKGDFYKAYDLWTGVRKKCPTLNEKIYTLGAELLKIKADRAKVEEKEPIVKELLALYDDYNKYFPNNPVPVNMYKAVIMNRYKVGSKADIYSLLDRAYSKNPTTFENLEAIELYMKLYFEKYKSGDKTITANHILKRRDDLVGHLEKLSEKTPANKMANDRMIDAIEVTVKEVATCDNLDAYYGEVFEKRKTDTLWLQVALKGLSSNHCRTSKLYDQITQAQQNIKPTAQSAYNLGVAAYQKADFANAAKYFVQSAELEKNPNDKANTYFTLASTVYIGRDKAKVKEYAMKALEVKPDFSKSYILLAQQYGDAGSDCAKTDFEKKALNWLAAETLKKAVQVDKNKGGLDKLIRKYQEKAPTEKEIKDAKMSGKTISYGCWINESVIVPKA